MLHPRYNCLLDLIDELKPQSILEIGTWTAVHACELIRRAQQHRDQVLYVGFDLFKTAPAYELSKPAPLHRPEILARLKETGARIVLIEGDTRESLARASLSPVDLIYIDGGHSLQTVRNDWKQTQRFAHRETVWVLDDYYPDRLDCGCRSVVDSLPSNRVSFLSSAVFDHEIRLVRVDPC